ncbi:MAG: redox-regulated ATPase YchF [Firmicutes bacterium]|nr:redox-regulated ATPase YchF [Bacillota bacterium]
MKLGIVGLPNVGKSTLFNCLIRAKAEAANYAFSTKDPNVGVAQVPDERVDVLAKMNNSAKKIPATVEFVDIAGLVAGSSKGEGLGNQFLSYIREVDALVHVVRCFEDENVLHVSDVLDPASDVETINLELVFADLEIIERRISKIAKAPKGGERELEVLRRVASCLEDGRPARSLAFTPEEDAFLCGFNLLTAKPVIFAANIGEDDMADNGDSNKCVQKLREVAKADGTEVFVICAKIEEEVAELDDEERKLFLRELGVPDSALNRLIAASYRLLGLISFLTSGPKETRAWTITAGTKAPGAAGKIHSDLERGFIRAEVVHYGDLMRSGSHAAAKAAGLVRLEGKDYVMKDGDVVLFRFNV